MLGTASTDGAGGVLLSPLVPAQLDTGDGAGSLESLPEVRYMPAGPFGSLFLLLYLAKMFAGETLVD